MTRAHSAIAATGLRKTRRLQAFPGFFYGVDVVAARLARALVLVLWYT
jgi:hypothetical protein